MQEKGQPDIVVDFLFSKPNRILATSSRFIVGCNEIDGHFESDLNEKTYDLIPWEGRVYPGTAKLVSPEVVAGGPVSSISPNKVSGDVPWKLERKTGSIERYTKTVQSLQGPQTYKLEVDSNGKPVKYEMPSGLIFVTNSFELVDELPVTQFRVEPQPGFVSNRIVPDVMQLQSGRKFTWSQFKSAPDVRSFSLGGNTLFALVDPSEVSSANSRTWLNTPNSKFKKVTISIGNATSGFYDPNGAEVRKLSTSTPTFVMVDKNANILGLWLGFDPLGMKDFEADLIRSLG